MKSFRMRCVICAIVTTGACYGAKAQPAIERDGCISLGKEPACILLQSGRIYDVSSANPKMDPMRHLGVQVMGTKASRASACGTLAIVLDNILWRYTTQTCP
jgi:hypothetical protein